ncbi:MAG: SHOCT domain-containing protein [Duncaniella sp.]|nr:SHOCT domain-containing protein [Duncaniella sp.]
MNDKLQALTNLKKLLDTGIITENEFTEQKKRILNDGELKSNETLINGSPVNGVKHERTQNKKLIWIIVGVIACIAMITFAMVRNCKNDFEMPKEGQNSSSYSFDQYAPTSYEEELTYETVGDCATIRYNTKYDEVNIADIHLMRADGKKIWYTPWTSTNESGYINKLYVYDSETDREKVINLNRTSMEDDYMQIDDMVERDGIITIIMSENRNSNGWVYGTYVWQYHCNSDTWNVLAKECSGAKFINNRTALEINYAECINPEDPTYLQEYRNQYKYLQL